MSYQTWLLLGLGSVLWLGAACSTTTAGTDSADATDCTGAALDEQGYCRFPNGRFARKACCDQTAVAPCGAAVYEELYACVLDEIITFGQSAEDAIATCTDPAFMHDVYEEICHSDAAWDYSWCASGIDDFDATLPACEQKIGSLYTPGVQVSSCDVAVQACLGECVAEALDDGLDLEQAVDGCTIPDVAVECYEASCQGDAPSWCQAGWLGFLDSMLPLCVVSLRGD